MAADDLITETKTRLEALLAPIDGGVGADLSYDESFEGLKLEVEKLQSLTGGKVDWGSIGTSGDEILSEKSKDFRVALYYAAARAQLDGLPGALDGLVLLQGLIAAFWEPMYPALKRPKARGNLCSWYSDLAGARIGGFTPAAKDGDLVKALDLVSRDVDSTLRDKLGEAYGGMSSLRSAIKNLLQILPKEAPPPPPPRVLAAPQASQAARSVEQAPPPPPVVAFSGGGEGAPITDADSALAAVVASGLSLVRAGDALRAADPGNPLAYRVARMGAWIELHQAPPAEDGRTLVPPPPDGLREGFEAMGAAENWLGVLGAAESAAAEYILWLDPHRYAANAMERLGALFINAKKALLREVAHLLLRVPAMAKLAYNDGTPFADGQTKMWLEAEVEPLLGAGGSRAGGGGAGAGAGYLDASLVEARGLAAGGQLPEAVAVLAKATTAAPTPADRFRGRLAVAKLCLQAQQFAIARAQLEGLDRLVEQHRLAEWEPDLCADLYGALYAAHRGAIQLAIGQGEEVSPDARARQALAFERLCQLDAGAALKMSAG